MIAKSRPLKPPLLLRSPVQRLSRPVHACAPKRLPAYRWVLEGLRAAAFLAPRTGASCTHAIAIADAAGRQLGAGVVGQMVGHCWPRGVQCARVAGAAVAVAGFDGRSVVGHGACPRPQRCVHQPAAGARWGASRLAAAEQLGHAALAAAHLCLACQCRCQPGGWPSGRALATGLGRMGCWMAWRLLALLLSLAVLLRLTARFIQSRWRTAVFALCLLGGMAAQFYPGRGAFVAARGHGTNCGR